MLLISLAMLRFTAVHGVFCVSCHRHGGEHFALFTGLSIAQSCCVFWRCSFLWHLVSLDHSCPCLGGYAFMKLRTALSAMHLASLCITLGSRSCAQPSNHLLKRLTLQALFTEVVGNGYLLNESSPAFHSLDWPTF